MTSLLDHKFKISFFIFIIACSFIFFFRLDVPSIRMWDESRLAVNALEMIINKNLIVTYFDGKPDMWNTKPPLLIWFIALSMKYFGFNEFALRLPSAICGMTTAVILFLFCKNYFHDLRAGIASGLVLITSLGFIREHVARTGDYDAMLVLWVVAYSISFFSYLHTRKQRQYLYLLIATIALVLAVWTKGIAGLMCLPGILLYTAWQKKLKKLLFSPEFYIAVTFFLVSSLGYYLLREYYNPGYINAVVKNELTGRYLNTVENNSGGFLFYYKDLISFKFIPWIYLLPLCFIITQFSRKKLMKNFSLFCFIYIVFYFLIISFAKTKLPWYDAPLYPMASLVIGLGISEGFQALENYFQIENKLKRLGLLSLLIICIFLVPYFDIAYAKIYKKDEIMYSASNGVKPQLMYGEYLKIITNNKSRLKKIYVVRDKNYNAQLLFYAKVANLKGYSIKLTSFEDKVLKLGDTAITCSSEIKMKLEQNYSLKPLHSNNSCNTFKIDGVKPKA